MAGRFGTVETLYPLRGLPIEPKMVDIEGTLGRVRAWAIAEWPAFLAVLVLVVGNVWLYGIQGVDWHPFSPVFLLAIAVFLGGEIARRIYRKYVASGP